MATTTNDFEAQKRQEAILTGVGEVGQEFGWPHFTKLTGVMLQRLIDAGTLTIASDDDHVFSYNSIFYNGEDRESLNFLLKYPKFVAQGYVGNCGVGTLTINTIVSYEPLTGVEAAAFMEQFDGADELWAGDEEHGGVFARAWFD